MPDNETWPRVRTWPGLSAEAKLTWLLLWEMLCGVPGTVNVKLAFVGNDQGAADPERFARSVLSLLAAHGLVRIAERDDEIWRVAVLDPAEVKQRQAPGVRCIRPLRARGGI